MHGNRVDIQALRGFAVLIVVLFHTQFGSFDAGYLGVDVFFVISGFLITTLVRKGIESGTFTFSQFYYRRAKRLLPATYVTLLATVVLAPWMLAQSELHDFALQIVGALTYTSNFVLWQQTGYFAGASELKPLLHMWSLAVEEQFYFVMPAALVFTPRRYWLAACLGALAVSGALCAVGVYWKPVATFYLLPARAWELLLGSIGALLVSSSVELENAPLVRLVRFLFWPAMAALVLVPFFPVARVHPGPDALIVCVATLIVILCKHPLLNNLPAMKALARVGDFSYSLYLVHWPIVAFANNAWAGEKEVALPLPLRLSIFILSIVLAYVMYRIVEEPVRRANFRLSRRVFTGTVLASLALGAATPSLTRAFPPGTDFEYIRRANYGLDPACESDVVFEAKPECRTSDTPRVLVWGDSHAAHLVPGLAEAFRSEGLVQATRSACGPLLDLAPMRKGRPGGGRLVLNRQWAEECIRFNDSVLAYLSRSAHVDTVVLSSLLAHYVAPDGHEDLVRRGETYEVAAFDPGHAVAALRRTAEAVRALGKKVVVVASPPISGFDIGLCLERELTQKLVLGAPTGCAVSKHAYEHHQAHVLRFLARLPAEARVAVIRFDSLLCGPLECATTLDGTLVYRDDGHFSYDGSRLVAQRAGLPEEIRRLAR